MQITTPTGTYKWIGDKWGERKINRIGTYGDFVFIYWGVNGASTHHTPEQLVKLGYMELIETKPEEKLEEAFTEDFPNTWGKNAEEKPTEEDHLDRWKYAVPTLPTHWYIETEEMKKSEYWEVFKEWYIKATNDDTYKWTSEMYGKSETSDFNGKLQYVEDGCKKLSPQQWYDTIYDGDRVVIAEGKLKSTEEDDGLLFGNGNKKGKTIFRGNEGTVFMEVDHDKAMEIPEVPEFEFPEFGAKRIDYDCAMGDQLRLITNSLNAVIKKINNL